MSVLIATPAYGGSVTVGYFNSMMEIAAQGHDVLVTSNDSNVCKARNNLCSTFRHGTWDTLAFIDADCELAPADFEKLLKIDAPIRGAAVPLKVSGHKSVLSCWYDQKGETVNFVRGSKEKPFKCSFLGAAVMLIDRIVIEKFYADESRLYNDAQIGPSCAIFENVLSNKIYLTEDYGFCLQARQMGFKILCDPDIVVSHYGQCVWRS